MWAMTHIRGHFFGGFRTTSRCEDLHSMLGEFVHSHHNLRDFVEQFFCYVLEMRSRETQSDMCSVVGHLVLQSPLHDLERSAAKLQTRKIFLLFRPMLSRACTLKVRSCTLTLTSDIYTISRSDNSHNYWHVSYYPEDSIFKCSCLRMESLGIPCDHIVALLVHLHFMEIPTILVLERWSKNARLKSNRRQGQQQQPSHEEGVDEGNYYTPNFGEEEYAHYHSQPVGQEEHFSLDEEEFQVPLTDPYYSWHE
ncbi:hypothetical protein HN873_052320 [Arachis hypogaea]